MKWSNASFRIALSQWTTKHGDDFDSLHEFLEKFSHLLRKRHKNEVIRIMVGFGD